jgi:type IV secretion system protein VirD4
MMLRTEHNPSLSYGWVDEMSGDATPIHPAVAHIARDMLSKSDRERNSIVSSTISYVEPFDDPILAANVSESDFSLLDLMNYDRPVSLYLTTPVADLERVQAIHRLLFTLAGVRNTEHLDFEDGLPKAKYKHKLLEVFDECAHLGYTPVIQKQFSLASGFGIQGMFVFQDFSQLFDLYGRNESITSNCDVKITFAPNNLQTSDYISRLLGNETREKEDFTKGIFLNKQNNKHSFARALLTPDECSRLPKDKSIVIRNGFSPILGDKVPYYQVRELLERTKIAPAKSDS